MTKLLKNPIHAEQLLQSLQELKKDTKHCDLILVIDGKEFNVQQSVLCAASPYFRSLFDYEGRFCLETRNGKAVKAIDIDELSAETFDQILKFTYSGEIELNEENIQDILQAADVLLMADLKNLCCEFLEDCICSSNCLGIRNFTELYSCPRVHRLATDWLETNFESVTKEEEFLQLPFEKLEEIVGMDNLSVSQNRCEFVILEASLQWIQYDEKYRSVHLARLLELIRWGSIPANLHDEVLQNPLVSADEQVRELVQKYLVNPIPANMRGYKNVIMVAGAFKSNQESSSCCLIVPAPVQYWIPMAPMLMPRVDHAIVATGGYVYVTGGTNSCYGYGRNRRGIVLNTGERYDPSLNQWTAIAPMLTCRENHNLVAINDDIYAIGGNNMNERELTSVEVYNILTDTWKYSVSMPIPRMFPCCIVMQKKIFVIGGCSQGQVYESVECYDPMLKQWKTAVPMKERRACACGVAVGDSIFVFGGKRSLMCPSAENRTKFCGSEVYIASKGLWFSLPPNNLCSMQDLSNVSAVFHIEDQILAMGDLYIQWENQCLRGVDQGGFGQWYEIVLHHPPFRQRNMKACVMRMPASVYMKLKASYS
ncbi:gigaxonin-like [Anneissia japonica]|uniref:gigaxonin-like n=1 Tax=Anneissia japonica TaxID=1529436 RepID=UPI001425608F|nr:gigaxonin-like [Anneissia japonica]